MALHQNKFSRLLKLFLSLFLIPQKQISYKVLNKMSPVEFFAIKNKANNLLRKKKKETKISSAFQLFNATTNSKLNWLASWKKKREIEEKYLSK